MEKWLISFIRQDQEAFTHRTWYLLVSFILLSVLAYGAETAAVAAATEVVNATMQVHIPIPFMGSNDPETPHSPPIVPATPNGEAINRALLKQVEAAQQVEQAKEEQALYASAAVGYAMICWDLNFIWFIIFNFIFR